MIYFVKRVCLEGNLNLNSPRDESGIYEMHIFEMWMKNALSE